MALSGKQRTPGGGTDLACMMGRETTLARVKAAIEKLNGYIFAASPHGPIKRRAPALLYMQRARETEHCKRSPPESG
ncbi:hypothetical protein P0G09_17440, partial [Faecalibacterium sp. DFI.5.82]